MQRPVYLDNNATTPLDPRVLEAMLPYLREEYGNASSASHAFGWAADEAVAKAREQVAELVHCPPHDLVFTSGATEAINFAMKGLGAARGSAGKHIVVTATEHRAVLDTCRRMRMDGFEISTVPVESDGRVNPQTVASALREDTILVAVIWANNETGVLNSIDEVSEIVRSRGVPLLSDATQAVGKIPVRADRADLMVASAHKMYGPKGVGILYLNPEMNGPGPVPLIDGGGQERGLRGGTLNTPGIVGMGMAAEIAGLEMAQDSTRLSKLRDQLEDALISGCPNCRVNGNRNLRLPQTTNVRFLGAPSAQLLSELRDVAVSSGSACSSGSGKPSHVLRAMGLSDREAGSSIRIGLGRFTTLEEVNFAASRIVSAVRDVRERQTLLHQK
ncbi:MAG TPA: cysteine desulfurase family protein [Rhodothermales bacterium]|nr:cysteine desulfurase family protein [Rhodothermales bacterium]